MFLKVREVVRILRGEHLRFNREYFRSLFCGVLYFWAQILIFNLKY